VLLRRDQPHDIPFQFSKPGMKRLLGKAAQRAVQIHIHVHSSVVLTFITHGRRTPLESDVNECHEAERPRAGGALFHCAQSFTTRTQAGDPRVPLFSSS
jgi:hypothetical protein